MKTFAQTADRINDQYEDISGSRQVDEALESDIEKLLDKMKQQRLEQRELISKMQKTYKQCGN